MKDKNSAEKLKDKIFLEMDKKQEETSGIFIFDYHWEVLKHTKDGNIEELEKILKEIIEIKED